MIFKGFADTRVKLKIFKESTTDLILCDYQSQYQSSDTGGGAFLICIQTRQCILCLMVLSLLCLITACGYLLWVQ